MASRKQPPRKGSERVSACETTLDLLGGSSQSTSIRGFSAVDPSPDLDSDEESIVMSSSSSSCATPPRRGKKRVPKRQKPTPVTATRKYQRNEVKAPKKKKGDPRSCCHSGCNKRMRGSSGYCRAHGGGLLCSVKNCDKFARLSGRCSFHGGYARCVEVGCEKRAYILGRCIQHSSLGKCTFEDCVAKAINNGFCAKHDNRSQCMHPGCSEKRLPSPGPNFCRVHTNLVTSLQRQLARQREGGNTLVPPQCLHYSTATSRRCRESAVPGSGLCSVHHTLSLCGYGSCSRKAQVDGLCLEHAGIVSCEAIQCDRPAERTSSDSRLCKEHSMWRAKCHGPGCMRPVFRAGHLCPAHHPTGAHVQQVQQCQPVDRPMDPLSHAEALLLLGGHEEEEEEEDDMSVTSEQGKEEAQEGARDTAGHAQGHREEGPRPDSRAGNGAAQAVGGHVSAPRDSLLMAAPSSHSHDNSHSSNSLLGPLDRWDVMNNLGPSMLLPLSGSGSGSFEKHTLLDLMEPGHWGGAGDVGSI